MWQALQRLGRFYVSHVVARATDFNALFALTLGLLALLYVAANMGVIGIQINVVLTRHLWPRALLTPFTDDVELTEADRRAYVAYAQGPTTQGLRAGRRDLRQGRRQPGLTWSAHAHRPRAAKCW